MKRLPFYHGVVVLALLMLGACRPSSPPSAVSPPVATEPSPTRLPSATHSPTSIPTAPPTPTSSPTPTPPPPTATPTVCAAPVCVLPGHFVLNWPVPPPDAATLAYYPFGGTARGRREPHHGLDLPADQGTAVYAPAAGEVVFAGADDTSPLLAPWPNYYGQAVVLQHSFPGIAQPVFTLYGHLETIAVHVGQNVQPGDLLGTVGHRGVAIGPHLHLEVRLGANTYDAVQNPLLWLRPPEGQGVLAWRITDAEGAPLSFDGVAAPVTVLSEAAFGPFYLETYADPALTGDPQWHETQALGNLPAGMYRLQVVALGCPHEISVAVEAARLTMVHWRLLPCP